MSTGDTVLLILTIGGLTIGLGSMLVGKIVEVYDAVKHSRNAPTIVMSRSDESGYRLTPSVSQTDGAQSSDRQMAMTRDQKITLYRTMREAGLGRDKARPILAAMGVPLDNNLWRDAAPPEQDDDADITPIAGRPTRKSYYAEPELNYESPPS